MKDFQANVEAALEAVLPPEAEPPAPLHAAMRWAVLGGGKRIRPQLCLAAAEAVGGAAETALMPACAIELLHAYTLVHDDLPAMDDDRERRGRPSVWAKFGEANAILAGDALQALAFSVLARTPVAHPGTLARLFAVLSDKALGVVRGQVADLAASSNYPTTQLPTTNYIYLHNTADLFMAAVCLGALAGGGTADQVERLRVFGRNLGLAFQHADDLLDGDSPYSRAETEHRIQTATAAARAALAGLPGDTAFLDALALRLATRTQ